MAKINPNAAHLIGNYIENLPKFSKNICEVLFELIHKADATVHEDWKWNIPVFHKNGMVCGFAAFKKHVSLTFFNGVLMTNKHQLFTDDCSAQKTRTIKFSTIEDIQENELLHYFREAFSLSPSPEKSTTEKKEIVVPELLQNALSENELAKTNFENMAYTYRKEYANHIADAKREATKLKRLKIVIANLEQNIKMHEQYKC